MESVCNAWGTTTRCTWHIARPKKEGNKLYSESMRARCLNKWVIAAAILEMMDDMENVSEKTRMNNIELCKNIENQNKQHIYIYIIYIERESERERERLQ